MPRLVDFDLFRKEVDKEPVIVRIFGIDRILPPVLPAKVMVELLRIQEQHGANENMPAYEVMNLAKGMLGAELMEELLDNPNFSIDDLGELIKSVVAEYTGQVEEAEEVSRPLAEGQAPPTTQRLVS